VLIQVESYWFPDMKTLQLCSMTLLVGKLSKLLGNQISSKIIYGSRPHGDEVRTVRFSNAAFYLLSGSYDKRLIITDMRGDLIQPLNYLPVAEHSDKIIQCR
jgi:hypothetical protein